MNNFKNGFKCYIDNTKCNKSYCISLFIKVGSCLESDDEKGISHFLEHMLFKGTKKFKNLSYILDINGFQYNAMTMKECTLFYIKSTKIEKIPLIINILYQIVFHSLLDPVRFDNEKTVVMDEILEDQSNINTVLCDMSENLMFNPEYFSIPIDSYDYTITGNNEDIERLTLKKVRDFYKKFYTVNNMFMVCTGNIGKDDNIISALETTFLQEKPKKLIQLLPIDKTLSTNRDFILVDGLDLDDDNSGVVIINYTICGYNNIDRYILNLYSYILTKGISSELFELLRNQNGIVYSIESSTDIYYKYFGLFNISFTTNQNNILKALELIFIFLKKDITQEQLDKAKILYIEEINFSEEDVVNKGESIGFNILYNSPVLDSNSEEDIINDITVEDVNTTKNIYITNEKSVIVHMSKIDDSEIKDFVEERFLE